MSAVGEAAPTADTAVARPPVPEGEQFQDLLNWLEMGLTRLEIEAIKAKGVSQLLEQLQQALAAACPPDLTETAERTRAAWDRPLTEEAAATSETLLNTLEPYQREIEHYFALEGQRRFHGLMAAYLRLFTRARYVGSSLRDRIPFVSRSRQEVNAPAPGDLSMFTRACSEVAANRLLVEADHQGFPLDLLHEPVEALSRADWRQRYAQALNDVLQQVEQRRTRPRGFRRVVQAVVVWLADWVPPLALLAAGANLLWRYFYLQQSNVALSDLLLPLMVLLLSLIMLHVLIVLLLPLRWATIRGEFQKELDQHLQQELENLYGPIPGEVAERLRGERQQVERLIGDTREVASWLARREQSASIAGLYGH